MLQDPVSLYEDARRRHQERIAAGARRRSIREQRSNSVVRSRLAHALRRAADAVDGRGGGAWRPSRPVEDA